MLLPKVPSLVPLWVFLALSAALSWTAWLWPIDHRIVLITKFHGWKSTWPLYNVKLVVGNALPGLLALVWVAAQGQQELRALLSSLLRGEADSDGMLYHWPYLSWCS